MKIAFLLAFLALLSACSYREGSTYYRHTAESFEITDSKSFFVDDRAPSVEAFNAALKAALAGDQNKLAYILSLACYTDGEGALSYGDFLIDLKAFTGSIRFNRAFNSLSEADQFSVRSNMKSADGLRRFAEKHQSAG